MKEKHQELVKAIEKQVVSILLARGLVSLKSPSDPLSFNNIRVLPAGTEAIDNSKPTITDEFIERYRDLFPTGRKGPGKEAVKKRLQKFIDEHQCKRDDIIRAAKRYISEITNPTYCMSAHYFLYKRIDGIDTSKAEEYLEVLEEEENMEVDFRDEFH